MPASGVSCCAGDRRRRNRGSGNAQFDSGRSRPKAQPCRPGCGPGSPDLASDDRASACHALKGRRGSGGRTCNENAARYRRDGPRSPSQHLATGYREENGAPGAIRTPDPQIRSLVKGRLNSISYEILAVTTDARLRLQLLEVTDRAKDLALCLLRADTVEKVRRRLKRRKLRATREIPAQRNQSLSFSQRGQIEPNRPINAGSRTFSTVSATCGHWVPSGKRTFQISPSAAGASTTAAAVLPRDSVSRLTAIADASRGKCVPGIDHHASKSTANPVADLRQCPSLPEPSR